ncbi:DUF6221 family protein [Streptomyces sp. NPDC059649]|uniref:DUF6221 family protein n=1 Tax=Streptomyces sp. NPDC059649 TaxID=3346895 RepID=UPI0036AD9F8D
MDELVRWLGEQLARDREIACEAKRVIGDDWVVDEGEYGFVLSDGDTVAYFEDVGGGTAMSRAAAVHAAEHDPARVLREIDAKRRMLGRINSHAAVMGQDEVHGDLLRLLALPYADRPGYREEWRP